MFCSDSNQRSLLKSRVYCVRPAKSPEGNVRELLRDTRAVQTIVPRYANTTVRTICSKASHPAIGQRFFSAIFNGLLRGPEPAHCPSLAWLANASAFYTPAHGLIA